MRGLWRDVLRELAADVFLWALLFWGLVLLTCGCGAQAAQTVERVVQVPVPVRCAVPPPKLKPWPKLRKCGDDGQPAATGRRFCAPTPQEVHVFSDNVEQLVQFAGEVLRRCAK